MEHSLQKLGLSQAESATYLYLVRNGCDYPRNISASTGLNRTNVYEALDRLVGKGLVSFVARNKVKWFQAEPVEVLLSLFEKKVEEFERLKDEMQKHIKNIKPSQRRLEASIFTGKKGLRILFESMLEENKSISLIAAELQFQQLFGPYFELWHKKRAEKRIPQRSIFPKHIKPKKRPLLTYRFTREGITNPTTTIVYGDTCLFIEWSEEPVAVKIESNTIAKSHQNHFDALWNSLHP